jgi:hypothetical protein
MSQWLKQSTAATLPFGPFVDSGDGDTEEESFTISQADIRLSKNGGAFAQSNNAAGATHMENGQYGVPLDTTDTNTLGRLRVYVHESGGLYVWQDFMVVPANVWDAMFGADYLQVDQVQVGGVASYIATGTVTAFTDETHVQLTGNAAIRKGAIVVATGGTGAVQVAVVLTHDSGTGDTVFEDPGFEVDLDGTTTYQVFAGPNTTALRLDAEDRVIAAMEAVITADATIEMTGLGVTGDSVTAV